MATSEPTPETRPESRPDTIDPCALACDCSGCRKIAFQAWTEKRLKELSAQFGVPVPAWEFRDTKPIDNGDSWTVAHYSRSKRLMVIFGRNPFGEPLSPGELHDNVLHEFFHHLENVNGVESNCYRLDHTHDFDRWINVLGLRRSPK